MPNLSKLKQNLQRVADKQRAINSLRFFKTKLGEYGAGDKFLGIKVPVQRAINKQYDLSLLEIQDLLNSQIHEYRFAGLLALMKNYKTADDKEQKRIFQFYLKNIAQHINNWDLVDISAPRIIGKYLLDRPIDRVVLYKLAKSKNLWERRVAIISAFSFIANCDFKDCLTISEILLNDKHDLIHKAVGWMLREIGKRDLKTLRGFLDEHKNEMPRTMLRYAIEKMSEAERKKYLSGAD